MEKYSDEELAGLMLRLSTVSLEVGTPNSNAQVLAAALQSNLLISEETIESRMGVETEATSQSIAGIFQTEGWARPS
jgi:hypothetical protein